MKTNITGQESINFKIDPDGVKDDEVRQIVIQNGI